MCSLKRERAVELVDLEEENAAVCPRPGWLVVVGVEVLEADLERGNAL